ncbi:hypothetical protein ACFFQW_17160 [Umezawaea endophytica]|uniref:Uncharacterized protein n=1 Tax=Umezawaea endophytica TaxID=1654476 RepID=A0A9X2VU09_9PSEU|nr:hypothetical protein [Umezawaea endophytica]MCS7482720.1 hypothetical protein [Umezawaea endophytica]
MATRTATTTTTIQHEIAERLRFAHGLLTTGRLTTGIWPKCCAWLLRTSLERSVAALHHAHREPSISMRTDLLTLPLYVDQPLANHTARLWGTLSVVANHTDYAQAPTVEELRGWHTETSTVTDSLLTALPDGR